MIRITRKSLPDFQEDIQFLIKGGYNRKIEIPSSFRRAKKDFVERKKYARIPFADFKKYYAQINEGLYHVKLRQFKSSVILSNFMDRTTGRLWDLLSSPLPNTRVLYFHDGYDPYADRAINIIIKARLMKKNGRPCASGDEADLLNAMTYAMDALIELAHGQWENETGYLNKVAGHLKLADFSLDNYTELHPENFHDLMAPRDNCERDKKLSSRIPMLMFCRERAERLWRRSPYATRDEYAGWIYTDELGGNDYLVNMARTSWNRENRAFIDFSTIKQYIRPVLQELKKGKAVPSLTSPPPSFLRIL